MKPSIRVAVALIASLGFVPAQAAMGQAPCAVSSAVVDSARSELMQVLENGGQVATEIRQEHGLPAKLPEIKLVRDAVVCTRIATAFGHAVNRGDTYVVLRVGPLYYAREPYQRRGTGVLTDSTFKVVAKLGVAIK
jgi:hypothetical protein